MPRLPGGGPRRATNALQTPQAVDDADATSPLQGDSDDPAIGVHPADRERSLVLATQKDGGLAVFDLAGQVLGVILPAHQPRARARVPLRPARRAGRADNLQVVVEDDEELGNAATNFKFVPRQGVANAFPKPLIVDPLSYDPRGTIDAQLAGIADDVISLVQGHRLARDDALTLLARLRRADVLQHDGRDVLTARQLGQFEALVAKLIEDDSLPVVPGGSLAMSAAACRTSLVERAAP
jgi:hypothetical protein